MNKEVQSWGEVILPGLSSQLLLLVSDTNALHNILLTKVSAALKEFVFQIYPLCDNQLCARYYI